MLSEKYTSEIFCVFSHFPSQKLFFFRRLVIHTSAITARTNSYVKKMVHLKGITPLPATLKPNAK